MSGRGRKSRQQVRNALNYFDKIYDALTEKQKNNMLAHVCFMGAYDAHSENFEKKITNGCAVRLIELNTESLIRNFYNETETV